MNMANNNNKMELLVADAMSYFRAVSEDTELSKEDREFASGFKDVLKRVIELGKNGIVRQYYDSGEMAGAKSGQYPLSLGNWKSFKEKFENDLNCSGEFAKDIDGLYSEVNRRIREFVEAGAQKEALEYLDKATVALDMATVAWEHDLLEKEKIYPHINPGVPLDERIAHGVKSSWPQVKELLEEYKSGLPKKIVAKNALLAAGLEAAGQKVAKDELELTVKKYEIGKKEELAGYVSALVQNFSRLGAISYGVEQ